MNRGLAVLALDRVRRFGVLNVLAKGVKLLAQHGLRGLPGLTKDQA